MVNGVFTQRKNKDPVSIQSSIDLSEHGSNAVRPPLDIDAPVFEADNVAAAAMAPSFQTPPPSRRGAAASTTASRRANVVIDDSDDDVTGEGISSASVSKKRSVRGHCHNALVPRMYGLCSSDVYSCGCARIQLDYDSADKSDDGGSGLKKRKYSFEDEDDGPGKKDDAAIVVDDEDEQTKAMLKSIENEGKYSLQVRHAAVMQLSYLCSVTCLCVFADVPTGDCEARGQHVVFRALHDQRARRCDQQHGRTQQGLAVAR